jgi:glycosyltransferase involved in cell wall biosynthesis
MRLDPSVVPVSVVIPCYRCADTIGRAVDSIFSQNALPSEVILVEDGSGDATPAVLADLAKKHPDRVKAVFLELNRGAASARNAGWDIATQPYVAFLDADDTWHPEKLRIQYGFMRGNPDVALCGHQCVWLREAESLPSLPTDLRATGITARSLLFRNAFSTPSVMLRRDIPFRFLEGKRCAEDLLLWQQVAFAGLPVVRLESPLAYVHKPLYGAGGLSAQMWRMEMGELHNLAYLFRSGKIGIVLASSSMLYSLAKFIRRLLVTKLMAVAKAWRSINGR